MTDLVLSVSDFVALVNQTLDFAYPIVNIAGELSNFRVSKNRWVYFDLKDENATVKFFGTVYQLGSPLEDGMMIQVKGNPRLHPLYGFSVNIQNIQPIGEGSIKKAAALLEAKLTAEGLFDPLRKRTLAYPPQTIGLITSAESAAYKDFIKIINERWCGVEIQLANVQVQGEMAAEQIMAALSYFNSHSSPVEVIVITRGGGSIEDLAVFNTEPLTRSVAASRIPTLVAIGHEVDLSLAELAADQRGSTPSNAAEILVPDKRHEAVRLQSALQAFNLALDQSFKEAKRQTRDMTNQFQTEINLTWQNIYKLTNQKLQLLEVMNPAEVLKRGYGIVRKGNKAIKSVGQTKSGDHLDIQIVDGTIPAEVK